MRRLPGLFAVLLVALVRPPDALGQSTDEPVVDGRFGEWSEGQRIYSDAQGDGTGDVDFGRLWMRNDDRFVYLSFEVTGVVGLESESDIVLGLDTDHDVLTGQSFESVGAELVWRFGDRVGTFTAGGASVDVAFQDVGLVSAPTVTSPVFELCFELDAQPRRLGELFPSDTVSVVLAHGTSGDRLPDSGSEALFVIDRDVEPRTYEIDLGRDDPSAFRLLSWNVEQDGLFESNRTAALQRILKIISPDAIVFAEIFSHSAAETLTRVNQLLAPGSGETWHASAAPSSVVLVSKMPIVEKVDVDPRGRAQGFIVSKPPGFEHDLLIIGAHLFCCDADANRQLQVDQIMATIRDARNDGSLPAMTPIIIAGDMNFVGDRSQPETLIQGAIVTTWLQPSFSPDWDDTPLTDAVPHTTGLPQTFTWISPRAANDRQFSPGRLDYMIYTDAVLSQGNSFALYTPAIRFSDLQRLGLSATDTGVASDHLPIVSDFKPKSTTAADLPPELPEKAPDLDVYPNPAGDFVYVEVPVMAGAGAVIEVFDALGRRVLSARRDAAGPHRFRIDVAALPAGFYVVAARTSQRLFRRGFVKRDATN